MKKKKIIIRLLIALLCAIIFALLVPYVYGERFTHSRWGMAFLFWMFCSAIAISPEITIIPMNLIEKKKRELTFDEILSGKEEPKEDEDFDSLISKKK